MAKKKRKFKLLDLPDSPCELAAMYDKLKDKERRLEADLAVKEHPEVEIAIIEIVLALSDVDRVDIQLRACEQTNTLAAKRSGSLLAQIETVGETIRKLKAEPEGTLRDTKLKFFSNKLETLEATVADGARSNEFLELRATRETALIRLRDLYEKWTETFSVCKVDLCALIPKLHTLLKGYDPKFDEPADDS